MSYIINKVTVPFSKVHIKQDKNKGNGTIFFLLTRDYIIIISI